MHTVPSRVSRPNRYYITEASPYNSFHRQGYSSYYDLDDDEEDQYSYLAAIGAEEERRARQENALRQQAYMEALERKRRQQMLQKEHERRRQYLMEVERRRREEEEQRELERQFMAHLARKRQEKLKAEQMRSQRARALEELKRQEMMKKRAATESCFGRQCNSLMGDEELIQGLDGNLYRIVRQNRPRDIRYSNPLEQRNTALQMQTRNQESLEGTNDEVELFPKSFFNVPVSDDSDFNMNTSKQKKKKSKKKATVVKSSILVGEVEDASDSECEEEHNDYSHNRRPSPGEWIEPVEAMVM